MSELRHDIEKYLRGELTPAEMHALEKKALSDPFLADALEGGSAIGPKDFSKDVDEINRTINKDRSVRFTPLRIAAGVIIVIGVSLFFVFNPSNEREQLAQKIKEEEKQPTEKTDSITPPPKQDQQLTLADKPKAKKSEPATAKPKEGQRLALRTTPATTQSESVTTRSAAPTTLRFQIDTTSATEDLIVAQPEVAKDELKPSHIAGTVTSVEDGLPLPGVTVVVKGTNQGTVTDINGNYSLDIPDTAALTFSFVGMHTNEVRPNVSGPTDVKLAEDVSQLSEVLITRSRVPRTESEISDVKLAEPVGGLRAYDEYLENNKQYPQQALDNDVKGRVVVGFDVGINGEIGNFTVIRSLGYGCDDEVIRLVKEGPQWIPTLEGDKPVESTVHVKMKFDAGKFKSRKKK